MKDRVLFVDDESNVLEAFKRQFRKLFDIEVAPSGKEGLQRIAGGNRFAVIVSDFKMPVMDGVQFLSRAKEIAPESVRIMLTGYADVKTAIEAVNSGHIFRFLTKPCPPELLAQAIAAGVKQYRLIHAEKELLEQTLKGAVKVLTEVLALTNQEAFGRSTRVTRYVKKIAARLKSSNTWKLETAAMLSQIGCITLPEEILQKFCRGEALSVDEEALYRMHPAVAADLLEKIPRMNEVAEIVACQENRFDGVGKAPVPRKGEEIPLGARILKVALDFDILETAGRSQRDALQEIKGRNGVYDPAVVAALEDVIRMDSGYARRSCKLTELKENMIFAADVRAMDGRLLITSGNVATRPLLQRLKNFSQTMKIRQPFEVLVPVGDWVY